VPPNPREVADSFLVLSVRGEERTKVKALDAGADDYITKPFGIEELLARVRAHLRRARAEQSEEAPIELSDFRIDSGARSVHVQGRLVHLTPKEFDLLVYLARHAGKVVTHRTLPGSRLGRRQHRASGIPARLRRPAPQEAGTYGLFAALHRD